MVVIMVVIAAAVVMAPGKGSRKNPEKNSLRKKGGIPLRLPTQKGAQMGVINIPLDALPAQKRQ